MNINGFKSMQSTALHQYITEQRKLIILEYELEKNKKKQTKIPCIDLFFIARSNDTTGKKRKWTTTLPLPRNLIPPDYLIQTDSTYVNVSDKIIVEFVGWNGYKIEGTVTKIRNGELTAVFDLTWSGDIARYKCIITFAPNDIVFKRKLEALKELPKLNISLQNMLCKKYPTIQIIPNTNLSLPRNYNFNESQKKAIRMAISNPFSLIQGPPGTGKTHTIGAIAIQALRNQPGKKVLICGTTNVSINSLLEIVGDMVQEEGYKVCWPASTARDYLKEDNLTKEQKLMTLYKSCHMDTPNSKIFYKLFNKHSERTEPETVEMNKLRDILEGEIIKESNVIFSTLDSSRKKSIVKNIGQISTLIVDEATLSVESTMIIPLSLCPDRFVLVGDHKQLGPEPSFDELRNEGFYESMFERIIKEKSCLRNSIMLNTQYRMHPNISYLPNKLFYGGTLLDGVKPEDREISKNFIFQKNFNFINFEGKEELNGTSYINTDEINQVNKFVSSLIESGVKPSQIGIISAYGAQTRLLFDHYRQSGIHVKVSTIDSFQGSQKDYIIICTTRNGNNNIGFLKDERRMNVAITRARRLVAIFGNAETLSSESKFWKNAIEYCKGCKSYYPRLPIKIEKQKTKSLEILKKTDTTVSNNMVSEFKEEENEAGYNLREIKSPVSDSIVRILWPDEEEDVAFLEKWVQERVDILNNKLNVTLAYDSESVCMQFGDIFDNNVDYYNWITSDNKIPEIKTNESIIVSFYQHKCNYGLDPILVSKMKPLLEHPKVTFITFDFTYDFDKLCSFGINIKTNRIIDAQLIFKPDDTGFFKDYICSTGWKSIGESVMQAIEDNDNSDIIIRAKENIKKGMKKFPHEENKFLFSNFNIPLICQFTKLFLQYSAGDIFYTAIAGVDILSRGELTEVREKSKNKYKEYVKYQMELKEAQYARQAYYVRESFTSAIQAQFSKDTATHQIMTYYKILRSFVTLLDNCPNFIKEIISSFNSVDDANIRQRYKDIIGIMENPENIHLGIIKDHAFLAHVHGIQKKEAFVPIIKEEVDLVLEQIKSEDTQQVDLVLENKQRKNISIPQNYKKKSENKLIITFNNNNSKSISIEKRSNNKQITIVQKSDQTQTSQQQELIKKEPIKISKPIQNEKDDSCAIFTKSQEKRLDV